MVRIVNICSVLTILATFIKKENGLLEHLESSGTKNIMRGPIVIKPVMMRGPITSS